MRKLAVVVLVAAGCGGSRHTQPATDHATPPDHATPADAAVAAVDPGAVTVDHDTVTLTLAGVRSVSSEPCRDPVAFAVQDGARWKDLVAVIHDKMYVLDGKPVGPVMCDYSPCQTSRSSDDVRLSAPLAGFEKVADQDGRPAYLTAALHGEVRVTFFYSTDQCQTYQSRTVTITRP